MQEGEITHILHRAHRGPKFNEKKTSGRVPEGAETPGGRKGPKKLSTIAHNTGGVAKVEKGMTRGLALREKNLERGGGVGKSKKRGTHRPFDLKTLDPVCGKEDVDLWSKFRKT